MNEKRCIRCGESFPVSLEEFWVMGQLRELKHAPTWIRDRFMMKANYYCYLCGNCYFDMTDE